MNQQNEQQQYRAKKIQELTKQDKNGLDIQITKILNNQVLSNNNTPIQNCTSLHYNLHQVTKTIKLYGVTSN